MTRRARPAPAGAAPSTADVRTPNALTVDVEGFVESNRESFEIPEGWGGDERAELERNMDAVLGVLAETGTRATFFFVGTVARRLPRLVERTAELGHEIGSHAAEHRRVYGQEPEAFRRALGDTKRHLEDLGGRPVLGFRAPDFSITDASLWALDVLRETGFAYDSSVYPIGMHDVYGIRGAERFAFTWPNGLVEFPLSTLEMLGRRVPFGGGGYFRLYPLWMTARGIASLNRAGRPAMFYVHPYEVGPVIPRVPGLSAYRRFRHYYGASAGRPRLAALTRRFAFAPAADVLRRLEMIDGGARGGASPEPDETRSMRASAPPTDGAG